MVERALLIAVRVTSQQQTENHENLLLELSELVSTLEIGVMETMVINIRKPHPHLFIGKGKAAEIIEHAKENEYDCIVFDDSLTPGQQRNWEQESGLCVIDRQEVILDIFASRAQTREAVLQVGLARMIYSLPRLTRAWTHLSRQRGGGTNMRGQGETQLEADQRLVNDRIASLKKKLVVVQAQRGTQRKKRMKKPVPTAAIVGYTNAGKSTILNTVTGSDILAEDKLFATLDPTTRQLIMPSGQKLLLTDTVGFVRKLPHNLIEAFKATLEEAVVADFLIHVMDASNPEVERHAQTTLRVLGELGAADKKMLPVFNKVDLCGDDFQIQRLKLQYPDAEFVSAITGEGMESLISRVDEMIDSPSKYGEYLFPFDRYDLIAQLHNNGCVKDEETREDGVFITGFISPALIPKMKDFKLQ